MNQRERKEKYTPFGEAWNTICESNDSMNGNEEEASARDRMKERQPKGKKTPHAEEWVAMCDRTE